MNRTVVFWGMVLMVRVAAGQSFDPQLDSLLGEWRNTSLDLDRRLNAFQESYARFHQEFPEVFLVELDTLLILGQTTNQPSLNYEAHLRRGGLLNYQGQNDEALEAYDKAEEVATALSDSLRLGSVEANRGNAYASRKEYIKALDHFSIAVKCYQAVGDSTRARKVRMALGSVFALLDDHVLAKAHYQEIADALPRSQEHEHLFALLDLNLGWSHYKLGEFDSAIQLSLRALEKFRQYNSGFHVAGCLTNLARIHLDMGSLELASAYVDSGITDCAAIAAVEDLVDCKLMRADIEQQMGRPQKALKLLDRIANDMADNLSFRAWTDLHRLKYLAHKSLGETKEALSEFEKFHTYHDSVQFQTNSLAIARAAYEKDMEHAVREVKMDAQRKRDHQSLTQLRTVLGLVIGFGAVVALLVLFILRMRAAQEKKRQQLLDEIESLKSSDRHLLAPAFESLNQGQLEKAIGRTLNQTDWNVLNLLFDNPTMTNAHLAERAFLSIDGIGSSLRRMYGYFNITETKYKKIALLHAAVTMSREIGDVHP